jgi:hypothetical protein
MSAQAGRSSRKPGLLFGSAACHKMLPISLGDENSRCRMLRNMITLGALSLLGLIVSCSDAPPSGSDKTTSSTASAPASPVSGKTAFWEMYKSAHSWASDLVPLTLESKRIPGVKNDAGKAAMWSATFGSPSRREARVFSYSIVQHAPDVYKGVTVGNPVPWSGPTRDVMPFDTSDIAVDSDTAYKTALTRAGAWVEKHPDKEFSCTLGNASRFHGPVWYVLWGDTKEGYAEFVDAKSGAIVNQAARK